MEDGNINKFLMQQVSKKFGSHDVLYSRYIPQVPASGEREYVRMTNAYMGILKDALESELPKLKDVYRENLEAEFREKRRIDSWIDTFLLAVFQIFQRIRNRVTGKVAEYRLQRRLKRISNLNLRLTTKEWKRAVKSTLGIDIREDYYLGSFYTEKLDVWVRENVGLIKTIPEDTLDKMQEIVYKGFTRGCQTSQMVKDIRRTYQIGRQRAELIARDQTAKLNGRIQQAQQMDAGIIEYIWSDCRDQRVRDSHRKLSGKKFSWDDPPVVDERTGRRCHPGQDYQCRCFARPVFNQTTLNLPIAGEDGGDHLSTVNGVRAGTESKDRFGIISNNNRGDPRYYDFVGKNMQLVESELSQRNFETAVCFDENGKAIFAQLGNEDSIRFTKIQQKRMKGKILTHNHPLGTPPSPEDLYVLKENRLKEFRTCGRNGTYVLRYSKEVEELPELSVLGDKYNIILDRLRPEYISKVEYGFDDRTALILLGEEIWKELGEEYGVILEYEKR